MTMRVVGREKQPVVVERQWSAALSFLGLLLLLCLSPVLFDLYERLRQQMTGG